MNQDQTPPFDADPDDPGPGPVDRPAVAAVAVGGAAGSLARWWVGTLIGTAPGQFPWGTFAVNVTGSLLIGVVMVWCTELRPASRWLRPFLGVGVLGGFTTFSTFAVETRALVAGGSAPTAGAYLAGSLCAGALAAAAGVALTRRGARRRRSGAAR